MAEINEKEVWHWYQVIEKFNNQELKAIKFCEQQGITYKVFSNRVYRILFKSKTDPELYAKIVPIGRAYLTSDMTATEFCKKYDIDRFLLKDLVTHLHYLDIIESIKRKNEKADHMPMTFVQVPAVQPTIPIIEEPEVLKKRNDIELIISSGVKVVVAPDVGADKLIRIIELLKDL